MQELSAARRRVSRWRAAVPLAALVVAGVVLPACSATPTSGREHPATRTTLSARTTLPPRKSPPTPSSTTSTAPAPTAPSTTTAAPPSSTSAPVPSSTIAATSTTVPPSASSTTSTPRPPTSSAAAGPGYVAGTVTVFGDSVTLDYAPLLPADLPGLHVDLQAAVGRQFYQGVTLAEQLRSEGRLGADVVWALGTNGPVTSAEVTELASVLYGASRVVFVTVHVDQPWQAEVNAALRRAAQLIPHSAVADWAALADAHPGWLYPDKTHLPPDGAGAQALAHLVATTLLAG